MNANLQKPEIIEKELSYKLVGVFFEIHHELGRFCREKQYGDALEKKLRERGINFQREYPVAVAEIKSNFIDFNIEDKIFVDLKAKPFIEKEDFYQMKRYIEVSGKRLGIVVNFRDQFLKPRRILANRKVLVDSPEFVVSHRSSGFSLVEILVMLGIITLLTTLIVVYGAKGTKYIILFREQARILSTIVRAKSLSISTYGQAGSPQTPCGYGVHFDADGTYILFKEQATALDCSDADHKYTATDPKELFQKYQLDKALLFKNLGATDIIFVPPNPSVDINPKLVPPNTSVSIVLGVKDAVKTATIKVNTFGQVSAQ